MKLADALKEAVLRQDWELVCTVYNTLRPGENLEPPKLHIPSIEDLAEMDIDMVRTGESTIIEYEEEEEEEEEDEFDFVTPAKNEESKYTGGDGETPAKKLPMNIPTKRKNAFHDDLDEATEDLPENNPVLQQVYAKHKKRKPREDEHNTGNKIDVICSHCGKEESISTLLAKGWSSNKKQNRYKCASCCTPTGYNKVLRQKNKNIGRKAPRRG